MKYILLISCLIVLSSCLHSPTYLNGDIDALSDYNFEVIGLHDDDDDYDDGDDDYDEAM